MMVPSFRRLEFWKRWPPSNFRSECHPASTASLDSLGTIMVPRCPIASSFVYPKILLRAGVPRDDLESQVKFDHGKWGLLQMKRQSLCLQTQPFLRPSDLRQIRKYNDHVSTRKASARRPGPVRNRPGTQSSVPVKKPGAALPAWNGKTSPRGCASFSDRY